MRLSEAILLGSTVLSAKSGGQYFSESDAGCALGMAAIANGCSFHRVIEAVPKRDRRTLGVEAVWGKWVLRVVMRPCECWPLRLPREMRIKDIIAHLFDYHVAKKKNWTIDQLVAWVQTSEPREMSSDPINNALAAYETISPQQRMEEQHAEQEWQQVRRGLEDRQRLRRSGTRRIFGQK